MGKELKGITAKEAREIADSSDFTLKHIYKEIRRFATENRTRLDWFCADGSKAAMNAAVNTLREAGFKVSVDNDNSAFTVMW